MEYLNRQVYCMHIKPCCYKHFKYNPAQILLPLPCYDFTPVPKTRSCTKKIKSTSQHEQQLQTSGNDQTMQLLPEIVSIAYGRYVLDSVLIHRDVMIHITKDSSSCS